MSRLASCSCGQLRVTCDGEPVRVSICHCPNCQRRTGSVYGAQARFPDDAVHVDGATSTWTRHHDDGDACMHAFCPTCGGTVLWRLGSVPGFTSVALGAFADPEFPAPSVSVWEETRVRWVPVPEGVERID